MDISTADGTDDLRFDSDLVDVTALSLMEVVASDESALAQAIRRLRADADSMQDIVAEHGSALTIVP